MSLFILKNEQITLAVESHGAEMKSLKSNETGMEYLWQADPAFWGRTSPILFPVVGKYKDNTTYYEDKTINLSQHGFARDSEFTVVSQTEDTIWLCLKDNEKTFAKYPFQFELYAGYQIIENSVKVMWKVKNPDARTLYFSIGAHPAFNCPLHDSEDMADYSFFFDTKEPLLSRMVGQDGFIAEGTITFDTKDGKLPITKNLFDYNTMIFEDGQTHRIALLTPEEKEYVVVSFSAPLVGIWTPVEKNAPFVCIEPWYGRSDRSLFNQQLAEREYGQKLEYNEVFEADYTIEVK